VSLRDILDAHQRALESGGAPGILSADAIQSAIGRPYSGYYRHIWSKAAALTHSLVTNHGFTDGNKRTALLAVHLLVERSGWTFVPDTENQIDEMLVAVAKGNLTLGEIENWYRARLDRARRPRGRPTRRVAR
jgi:death-on-curing protein